jgi:hypothetical protein
MPSNGPHRRSAEKNKLIGDAARLADALDNDVAIVLDRLDRDPEVREPVRSERVRSCAQ